MSAAYLGGRRTEAARPDAPKPFANLRARLGLRGIELHELANGEFMLRKFGLVTFCRGLDEVEAFARKVGA